jgi:hypothetical protein
MYLGKQFEDFLRLSLKDNTVIQFRVGTSVASAIVVDWGDGSTNSYSGISCDISHTYEAGAFTGEIGIRCADGNNLINAFDTFGGTTSDSVKFTINQLNAFVSLKTFNCNVSNLITGDITNKLQNLETLSIANITDPTGIMGTIQTLPLLKVLDITGTNTLSGDVTFMTGLTRLSVSGNNSIGGSITNLIYLQRLVVFGNNTLFGNLNLLAQCTFINVGGNNAITGNISNLSPLLTRLTLTPSNDVQNVTGSLAGLTGLVTIELRGNNTITGAVTGLTNLVNLTVTGNNTISGDISGLFNLSIINVTGALGSGNTLMGSINSLNALTFLQISGTNTVSGSITTKTGLTFVQLVGLNVVSGDANGLINASSIVLSGNNTITITNVNAITKLSNLSNSRQNFSSSVVNTILAGFRANNNVPKVSLERNINLVGNGSSGAPTGQGVDDKIFLQNPANFSPPGTTPWTVTTN